MSDRRICLCLRHERFSSVQWEAAIGLKYIWWSSSRNGATKSSLGKAEWGPLWMYPGAVGPFYTSNKNFLLHFFSFFLVFHFITTKSWVISLFCLVDTQGHNLNNRNFNGKLFKVKWKTVFKVGGKWRFTDRFLNPRKKYFCVNFFTIQNCTFTCISDKRNLLTAQPLKLGIPNCLVCVRALSESNWIF